jgi:hypothetical protein
MFKPGFESKELYRSARNATGDIHRDAQDDITLSTRLIFASVKRLAGSQGPGKTVTQQTSRGTGALTFSPARSASRSRQADYPSR